MLHLIANNKSYLLRDDIFFLYLLPIKKKKKENGNSFLPFLLGGHVQLKGQIKI